jgi:hypothetical protein
MSQVPHADVTMPPNPLKSPMRANQVVEVFKINRSLQGLLKSEVANSTYGILVNGVKTCCKRFVLGLIWIPGRGRGKAPMVSLDQVWELCAQIQLERPEQRTRLKLFISLIMNRSRSPRKRAH